MVRWQSSQRCIINSIVVSTPLFHENAMLNPKSCAYCSACAFEAALILPRRAWLGDLRSIQNQPQASPSSSPSGAGASQSQGGQLCLDQAPALRAVLCFAPQKLQCLDFHQSQPVKTPIRGDLCLWSKSQHQQPINQCLSCERSAQTYIYLHFDLLFLTRQ